MSCTRSTQPVTEGWLSKKEEDSGISVPFVSLKVPIFPLCLLSALKVFGLKRDHLGAGVWEVEGKERRGDCQQEKTARRESRRRLSWERTRLLQP